MLAGDADTDNPVLARLGEHLDVAMGGLVGNRPIEVVDAVAGHFIGDVLRPGLAFGEADPRHLRVGEGAVGNHPVVRLEAPEAAEQRIDRGVPGLVRGDVGELVGTGDIAHRIDVGQARGQVLVGFQGTVGTHHQAQLLDPVAADVGHPAEGQQQAIEGDGHFLTGVEAAGNHALLAIDQLEALGAVLQAHIDAVGLQAGEDQFTGIGILARQQAFGQFDLNHLAAETLKGLGQLAADRPAAQHQQPAWLLAQAPDGVRGVALHLLDTGDLRHQRARASGDDDAAAAQGLAVHLHRPGRGEFGFALDHLDAQSAVALDRVVRGDIADHPLDALHHRGKIHRATHPGEAQRRALLQFMGQPGRTQQRLGRHAAGVQAVAAHLVLFDQADLGLHRRSDVGTDQPTGTGADHQQIAVEGIGLEPAGIYPSGLHQAEQLARKQGEQAEQDESTEQSRRENPAQRLQLAQLAAGVHIDQGARQHAELADPPVGTQRQAGQAHGQVDQKEREHRHQAQCKQVVRPFALDPGIDPGQALTEALAHPVAQQKAAAEHGQGRAHSRGEGHQHQAFKQTEQRPGQQGHQGRTGQRQGRDGDIGKGEQPGRLPGIARDLGVQRRLLRLERLQVEVLTQVEDEEAAEQGQDQAQQGEFATIHGSSASSAQRLWHRLKPAKIACRG